MILLHVTVLTPAEPLSLGEIFTWTLVVFAAVLLVAWALSKTLQRRPWLGPVLAALLLFLIVWSLVAHVAGPHHRYGGTFPSAAGVPGSASP